MCTEGSGAGSVQERNRSNSAFGRRGQASGSAGSAQAAVSAQAGSAGRLGSRLLSHQLLGSAFLDPSFCLSVASMALRPLHVPRSPWPLPCCLLGQQHHLCLRGPGGHAAQHPGPGSSHPAPVPLPPAHVAVRGGPASLPPPPRGSACLDRYPRGPCCSGEVWAGSHARSRGSHHGDRKPCHHPPSEMQAGSPGPPQRPFSPQIRLVGHTSLALPPTLLGLSAPSSWPRLAQP